MIDVDLIKVFLIAVLWSIAAALVNEWLSKLFPKFVPKPKFTPPARARPSSIHWVVLLLRRELGAVWDRFIDKVADKTWFPRAVTISYHTVAFFLIYAGVAAPPLTRMLLMPDQAPLAMQSMRLIGPYVPSTSLTQETFQWPFVILTVFFYTLIVLIMIAAGNLRRLILGNRAPLQWEYSLTVFLLIFIAMAFLIAGFFAYGWTDWDFGWAMIIPAIVVAILLFRILLVRQELNP